MAGQRREDFPPAVTHLARIDSSYDLDQNLERRGHRG